MEGESQKDQPSTSSGDTGRSPLDPRLDWTSETFDPEYALYSDGLDHLLKERTDVTVYDNLAMFESKVINVHYPHMALPGAKLSKSKTDTNNESKPEPNRQQIDPLLLVRRFQPHQMMVSRPKKNKFIRTLITKWEIGIPGPIGALRTAMVEKRLIKIRTKRPNGVYGTITGCIEAFDKHWNLVLSNVHEVYKRRRAIRDDTRIPDECKQRLDALGIDMPTISEKSLNRHNVIVDRKLSQLLIRGEQIVSIITSPIPDEKQY